MGTEELVNAINQYGFPIIAAMGLGYFVFFIWRWATEEVDAIIGEAQMTLIKLIDRVRMLDNDLIRLNTKLDMVLEYKAKYEQATGEPMDLGDEDLEEILHRNKSFSTGFNSTGKPDDSKKKIILQPKPKKLIKFKMPSISRHPWAMPAVFVVGLTGNLILYLIVFF